jgi:hypothetical protein
MTQPTPQVLETYTLLQIAAEAFLGRERDAGAALPGGKFEVQLDVQMLMAGNTGAGITQAPGSGLAFKPTGRRGPGAPRSGGAEVRSRL